MNFKIFGRAVCIKAKSFASKSKRSAKSYVSLFVAFMLIVGSGTAWFVSKQSLEVSTQTLKMNSENGIHDDSMRVRQKNILIPNFRLEEASSVDGRNIYFPASFKDNVSDAGDAQIVYEQETTADPNIMDLDSTRNNFKEQTKQMVYREGNAGDKNVRYAYSSADITASGSATNVWLKGYKLQVFDYDEANNTMSNIQTYQDQIDLHYADGGYPDGQVFPDTCPVRVAIIDDSGHTPKIFDPSAKVRNYVINTDAVYSIHTDGKPGDEGIKTTNLDSFSSYYYGTANPLFRIEAGHTINVTVVAWLEGSHPFAQQFAGKTMTLELEIETNVSQMEYVFLHDYTVGDDVSEPVTKDNYIYAQGLGVGHWISGNVILVMSYYDQYAQTYKSTVMTHMVKNQSYADEGCSYVATDDYTYMAAIPKYVNTKISFYRLSNTGSDSNGKVKDGTVFNSWHTYSGLGSQMNNTSKSWSNNLFGALAATRNISNTTNTYVHYYAIRGNGHSFVNHTHPDRYKNWLSPCVGYWGTESGPVDTGSTYN